MSPTKPQAKMTSDEFAEAHGNRWDSDLPPSRAWDQLELNMHHDYVDLKSELARLQHLQASSLHSSKVAEIIDVWNRIAVVDRMTANARKARLEGEDALHWRLRYDDKEAPDVEDL